MSPTITIRPAESTDAPACAAIYNPYVTDSIITFEETVVSAHDMAGRMAERAAAGHPWLVAEANGHVLGYAYAGPWRTRVAYRFVLESAVYVADAAMGRGVGRTLYTALFDALRAGGIRAVMGVISLPNPGSVAFHEALGFVKAGHFARVGYKFGRWIDVGYWQLDLDGSPAGGD